MRPDPLSSPPLSAVDYAWLRMDDPTNLMMINGVLVMEGPVDLGRLREVMVKRLLPIPRFRQRVATPPKGGWPRWEADPDFDIDHHLTPVTLPEPGDDAELRAVIEGLASAPLDPTRPLWHFHAIANYRGGTV
ncbi:MAG TPA: wax ester/triacylglycerol synthase domain-containing protein, partial [Thermoanaerobaculia bacterium]|nr:wax ester/triacylglycerol synthase domain-containing protein [Thermoanaerobaculia bacterium]